MTVSHSDCAPYLSASLFRVSPKGAAPVGEIRQAIAKILGTPKEDTGRARSIDRTIATLPTAPRKPGREIAWFRYEEKRPPPWYNGGEIDDTYNHIVIVYRKAELLALTFSDTGARNLIVREIRRTATEPFLSLHPLSLAEVDAAFVEKQVRTLWLTGTHRRSVVKPDAKVLSGLELESALDPLDDQATTSAQYEAPRPTETCPLTVGPQ